MTKQLREALEAARKHILGRCEDWGDAAVIHKIDAALSAPAEQAPRPVTDDMVRAYLTANNDYWHKADALPDPIGKWRQGTPFEATRVSLEAALAASPSAPTAVQPAKLKRGTTGKCVREAGCECEAAGLGDECIWLAPFTLTAVKEAGGVDELPSFDDPRVKAAYNVLVGYYPPPKGEEWESFAARNVVAEFDKLARAAQPATPVAPKILEVEALTEAQLTAAVNAWFSPESGDFLQRMRLAIKAAFATKLKD